jgi:hypothetical protein
MEERLHPELAREAGVIQEEQTYDVHPSLVAEREAPAQPEQEAASAPEETIEVAEQQETKPEITKEAEPVAAPADAKEQNWRAMRAQAEKTRQLEKEAQELARERDYYREQALKKQQVESQDEDYRSDYEKKLARELENLRAEVANQAKETAAAKRSAAISRGEQRLVQDYPDINQVVTDDNIKVLEMEYPHLYNSVIASNDVYTVGSAAYELIVAKGIYKKPSKLSTSSASQQIARNQNKPKSVSTVAPQSGETPIQRAGNFMGNSIASEDERKALYQEMINSSRHRSF